MPLSEEERDLVEFLGAHLTAIDASADPSSRNKIKAFKPGVKEIMPTESISLDGSSVRPFVAPPPLPPEILNPPVLPNFIHRIKEMEEGKTVSLDKDLNKDPNQLEFEFAQKSINEKTTADIIMERLDLLSIDVKIIKDKLIQLTSKKKREKKSEI